MMNNSTAMVYIAVMTISSINNIALICIIYIIDISDVIAYIMSIICIQLQIYFLIILPDRPQVHRAHRTGSGCRVI
jgi:hypothetical protein